MWLFLLALGIIVATLLNKILGFHSIHRHIFACSRRTDTRRQTRFENLTRYYRYERGVSDPIGPQDPVTFDFSVNDNNNSNNNTVIVEIPANSRWKCLYHCHQSDEACLKMFTILSGAWAFHGGYWGARPYPRPIARELRDSFDDFGKNLYGGGDDATAARAMLSFFSNRPRQLEHQLCSAVQDAEVYGELCSTPVWVRVVLALLRRWASEKMHYWAVQRALSVQIRAMLAGRDYLEYHGSFTGLRLFYSPLPAWAQRVEERSKRVISKGVLKLNRWAGVWLLGMEGWYGEYELHVQVMGKEKEER